MGRARKVLVGVGTGVAVALAMLTRRHVTEEPARRGSVAMIGWAFLLSFGASVSLTVIYALGGQPQAEGAMLFVALGGIAIGLVLWSHRLMPQDVEVEERKLTFDEPEEREEAEEAFIEGAEQIGRRSFLGKLLVGAVGALGVAFLFPIRSLGKAPGRALFHTAWKPGARAVTEDGQPVRAASLLDNSVLTVFPEGNTEAGDSQTLLIKTPQGLFRPKQGRETWSPDGIVGFSKICTHAGCPVGLYQAATSQLFCPCHQSVFSVPDACKPTSGPATRALPQLPLAIDPEGFVIAQSDFHEPVGPEFWNFGEH
ncbi:MAG TPA: Rieske 2Fe-2S domain-containing protein [Actinomycetota bacterium]|nr:Rieske 2Fe-2S domain-containing protein [Actinomycetota bacterium]